MVAVNGNNLLRRGQSSAPIHPFWRRNPFHYNNFIAMQETQNKEKFTFLILS